MQSAGVPGGTRPLLVGKPRVLRTIGTGLLTVGKCSAWQPPLKMDDETLSSSWECTADRYCSTHDEKLAQNTTQAACQVSCAASHTCFAFSFYPNLCGPTKPGSCLLCRDGYTASKSACPKAQLCINPHPPPPPPPPPPPLPGWHRSAVGVNAMAAWPWPAYTRKSDQLDAGSVPGYFIHIDHTSVGACEAACAAHVQCGVWSAGTSAGITSCYLRLDHLWWPTGDGKWKGTGERTGSGGPAGTPLAVPANVVSGCAKKGTKNITVYNCGASFRPACCGTTCSPDSRCDMTNAFAPTLSMGTCDVGSPSFGSAYCDKSRSYPERAAALTAALSTEEKLRLWTLHSVSFPVARLNIKSFGRDTICQHGLSNNWNEGHWFLTNSTVFPHGINQGASFDTELVARLGNATTIESRATNNVRFAHSKGQAYAAILCDGGPLANTAVHAQWGRTAESYGECPYATGAIGRAAVTSLQQRSADGQRLAVAVVTRHFMGGHQSNFLSNNPQMNITKRESTDHYYEPYGMQLLPLAQNGAEADAVMCAFTDFNGTPSCASKQLLQGELRQKLNSTANVVSDCCDSITSIKTLLCKDGGRCDVVATFADGIAMAVNAGTQLCFGCSALDDRVQAYVNSKYSAQQALDRKLITMAQLDSMTTRNFLSRFRLGEYDGTSSFIDAWQWATPMLDKFQGLAREAAAKSVVLVKNNGKVLPLSRTELKSLAVIGPFAHCEGQTFAEHPRNCYLAGYNGNPSKISTILDGIRELSSLGAKIAYTSGCEAPLEQGAAPRTCSNKTINAAATLAANADVTVIAVGLGIHNEAEGRDRLTLDLPEAYKSLLAAVSKTAKKLVLISVSAGGVSSTWTAASSPADAILFAGYPGQNADGVADVLFGAVSPSAKLPLTVYALDYLEKQGGPNQEVNYHLAPPLSPVGKTYRYLNAKTDTPLWSFGFGLSYSTFEYTLLAVTASAGGGAIATATITNTGGVDAAEVSMLFISPRCTGLVGLTLPLISLRRFVKNMLAKGEKKVLSFVLDADDFAVSMEDGSRAVPTSCTSTVSVGGSQPGDPHATAAVQSKSGFKPKAGRLSII